jgi:hypothetical protein
MNDKLFKAIVAMDSYKKDKAERVSGQTVTQADVYLASDTTVDNADTIIHEVLHALGLSHPREGTDTTARYQSRSARVAITSS